MDIMYRAVPDVLTDATLTWQISLVAKEAGITKPVVLRDMYASVAYRNNSIVGFALYGKEGIAGLWVCESLRGSGIANELIAFSCNQLSNIQPIGVANALTCINALYGTEGREASIVCDIEHVRPAGFWKLLHDALGDKCPGDFEPEPQSCWLFTWSEVSELPGQGKLAVALVYGLFGLEHTTSEVRALLGVDEGEVTKACELALQNIRVTEHRCGRDYFGLPGNSWTPPSRDTLLLDFLEIVQKMSKEGIIFHDNECDMDLHLDTAVHTDSGYRVNLTHYKNM